MQGFLPKIIYRDQLGQIVFILKQVIRLLWQSNPRFTIFIFILSAVWGLLKISTSKILIFVSQRFSTVRRADRIVVIDKGRVVEEGTHQSLMQQKGKYARLFSLQAKGYK